MIDPIMQVRMDTSGAGMEMMKVGTFPPHAVPFATPSGCWLPNQRVLHATSGLTPMRGTFLSWMTAQMAACCLTGPTIILMPGHLLPLACKLHMLSRGTTEHERL